MMEAETQLDVGEIDRRLGDEFLEGATCTCIGTVDGRQIYRLKLADQDGDMSCIRSLEKLLEVLDFSKPDVLLDAANIELSLRFAVCRHFDLDVTGAIILDLDLYMHIALVEFVRRNTIRAQTAKAAMGACETSGPSGR